MALVPKCTEEGSDIFCDANLGILSKLSKMYEPFVLDTPINSDLYSRNFGYIPVLEWFGSQYLTNKQECTECHEVRTYINNVCDTCSQKNIGECTQCHEANGVFNGLCWKCSNIKSECTQCHAMVKRMWISDGICLACGKDNARRECVVCKRMKILNFPSDMCNKCQSESDIVFECSKCPNMDVLIGDVCSICYAENNSVDNVD